MRLKSYRLSCVLVCSLLVGGVNAVMADDTDTPTYQNPAQAAHAANLSEAALPAADAAVKDAEVAVDEAEANLAEAKEGLTEEQQLEDLAVQEAQDALDAANQSLYDAVGRVAGLVDGSLVRELREDQMMGWGEIAHELGVHPGVLGLGHTKDKGWKSGLASVDVEDEIAESTSMNLKTGNTKGHENANANKSGKSEAASGSGKGNGNKGGNGNSSGGGNGGGHGNGGGNGGGNGNGGGGNKK